MGEMTEVQTELQSTQQALEAAQEENKNLKKALVEVQVNFLRLQQEFNALLIEKLKAD